MSKKNAESVAPAPVSTSTPKATATVTAEQPQKRTMFMLYDGSYESAFSAVRLARDTKIGDPNEGHDYNLVIFEPKLNEADAKTFEQVKEIIKRDNPEVVINSLNVDNVDLTKPDVDKTLGIIEAALNEALKAGLKSTVLKVTWTTDRINSNKDVYQHILMVKAPVLVNKLENSLKENQEAVKENKPMVRTIGIDFANFGKLDEDIAKHKPNLGLHNIFKEQVINP